jgi:hypothetical protein
MKKTYEEVVMIMANQLFHSLMNGSPMGKYDGGRVVAYIYDKTVEEIDADVRKCVDEMFAEQSARVNRIN